MHHIIRSLTVSDNMINYFLTFDVGKQNEAPSAQLFIKIY